MQNKAPIVHTFALTIIKINKMKNIFLLLTINLYIFSSVNSQISYENRIEIELKNGYSDEEIFEFGKNGFVMSSRSQKKENNQIEWKYQKYDAELKEVQTKSIFLDDKLNVDQTFTNKDNLHTFFMDRKGNFTLVTVQASDMEFTQIDGVLPKKALITEMSIVGDYAFFNAYIKRVPFLFSINWKNGDKKLIPIEVENIKPKNTDIMNLQVLENSNEVFAYVKAIISRKKSDIYVIRLNSNGEKEEIFNLTKNIEKNIIDVSALKLKEGKYIFTGTYSTLKTGLSEGLFICQTEKSKIDFIEFYNFLDLENFLSYLPEKKQKKIEKKKEKKEKKGKTLQFNYRISPHEIISLDDGFLYLGEAYYPTYRTESYTTTTTVNGVATTTTQTKQVFDGYQYTHAVLGKFDKNGKLLWNQTFVMWNAYKPIVVKRFISIAEKGQNSIKLVFATQNKINSKSIDFNGSVLQSEQSEEIQTNFEGDKVKRSFSDIHYWYDNYFIAYGVQKIKNTDDKIDSKRKRKVYFVNKIKFVN